MAPPSSTWNPVDETVWKKDDSKLHPVWNDFGGKTTLERNLTLPYIGRAVKKCANVAIYGFKNSYKNICVEKCFKKFPLTF